MEEELKPKEENMDIASNVNEIDPFRKVKGKLRKKIIKRTLIVAVVSVFAICFGILVIGQIFPQSDLPSPDRIKITAEAKKITKALLRGDSSELVDNMVKHLVRNENYNYYFTQSLNHIQEDIRPFTDEICKKLFCERGFKIRRIEMNTNDLKELSGWEIPFEKTEDGMIQYVISIYLENATDEIEICLAFSDVYYGTLWYISSQTQDVSLQEEIVQLSYWMDYLNKCTKGYDTDSVRNQIFMEKESDEVTLDKVKFVLCKYFTTDCLTNEALYWGLEPNYTTYQEKISKGLYQYSRVYKTKTFTFENRYYDTRQKRIVTRLFWEIELDPENGIAFEKDFYYGPMGYEPADKSERIYVKGNVDEKIIKDLETLFDK